jgi:hypothetical protein
MDVIAINMEKGDTPDVHNGFGFGNLSEQTFICI